MGMCKQMQTQGAVRMVWGSYAEQLLSCRTGTLQCSWAGALNRQPS